MKIICDDLLHFNGNKTTFLTWTTAMACPSWSIPALVSCPGADLKADNSVCKHCYALINNYSYKSSINAQKIRYDWTIHCLKNNKKQWIDKMIEVIEKNNLNNYFRIHDSGDFINPDYVDMWFEVCKALPNIKFWAPTRCWNTKSKKFKKSLSNLNSLNNVSIQPSALKIGDKPPVIDYLSKGSGVILNENLENQNNICPKSLNGSSCLKNNCRSCWDGGKETNFIIHSYSGRKKPYKVKKSIISYKTSINENYSKFERYFE